MVRVIVVAMGIIWVGYGVGTWGWCLVRGYDIPASQWFSPVSKFEWPKPPARQPFVPATSVFPPPAGPSSKSRTAPAGGSQGTSASGQSGGGGYTVM